jgi:LPXTG-motif cell wall-anchored protein
VLRALGVGLLLFTGRAGASPVLRDVVGDLFDAGIRKALIGDSGLLTDREDCYVFSDVIEGAVKSTGASALPVYWSSTHDDETIAPADMAGSVQLSSLTCDSPAEAQTLQEQLLRHRVEGRVYRIFGDGALLRQGLQDPAAPMVAEVETFYALSTETSRIEQSILRLQFPWGEALLQQGVPTDAHPPYSGFDVAQRTAPTIFALSNSIWSQNKIVMFDRSEVQAHYVSQGYAACEFRLASDAPKGANATVLVPPLASAIKLLKALKQQVERDGGDVSIVLPTKQAVRRFREKFPGHAGPAREPEMPRPQPKTGDASDYVGAGIGLGLLAGAVGFMAWRALPPRGGKALPAPVDRPARMPRTTPQVKDNKRTRPEAITSLLPPISAMPSRARTMPVESADAAFKRTQRDLLENNTTAAYQRAGKEVRAALAAGQPAAAAGILRAACNSTNSHAQTLRRLREMEVTHGQVIAALALVKASGTEDARTEAAQWGRLLEDQEQFIRETPPEDKKSVPLPQEPTPSAAVDSKYPAPPPVSQHRERAEVDKLVRLLVKHGKAVQQGQDFFIPNTAKPHIHANAAVVCLKRSAHDHPVIYEADDYQPAKVDGIRTRIPFGDTSPVGRFLDYVEGRISSEDVIRA